MVANSTDGGLIYRLKATIANIRPPVWRRIEVPADVTLADLHDILQVAFGWTDSHLHQFVVGRVRFGVPDPDDTGWGSPVRDERRTRLQEAVKRGVKSFVYEYDFGDGWEHRIVVEKTFPAVPGAAYPACVAGRRACPPEDCGGPWGYAALLEATGDPDHPEHDEMQEWLGDAFDPEAFDLDAVNALLAPPRARRR